MRAFARGLNALLTLAVVIIIAGAGWFWYTAFADTSKPQQQTQVVIPRGSTLADIAQQLSANGVISNAFAFRALARLRHSDAEVRAGAYRFAPHQAASSVLQSLLTGGAQVAVWVTIPEGFTAAQIAERLQDAGVGHADALQRSFLTTPLTLGSVKSKNLEGYLFPSTYLVPTDATAPQIAKQLTDQFRSEIPPDAAARAKALGVSVPQAVTVASLVEREAKVDADRPHIAGVIYNRLKLRMPLQVDATIEYALPSHKTELSFADLKIDSPYNSYTHDGLPPTPIANPGAASLKAAFTPTKTDDLYYVYCGNGRHVFAKTNAEHQANVARCLH